MNAMARRTKKVQSAGRFQARYGVKSRTRVRDVETQQHAKHICPKCNQQTVKRKSTGIWECRKCGNIFAGGAYNPKTAQGFDIDKSIRVANQDKNE